VCDAFEAANTNKITSGANNSLLRLKKFFIVFLLSE